MQEKTIKELRQELKEQIKENQELIAEIKELNVDNEWWNNRYKAQVRINEEHKKINGELRKENDALITVIDLVKEYINKHLEEHIIEDQPDEQSIFYDEKGWYIPNAKEQLLEILERVNEK